MSFQGREPANFANHKRIRGQTKIGPQSRIVFRLEKGFHFEATENARVHVRMANAGSQVLASHGLSGADEVSRDFAGRTFSGEKDLIGDRSLERPERWAMNMMNDDRDASAASRQPAKEAGLAAVGMNDLAAHLA